MKVLVYTFTGTSINGQQDKVNVFIDDQYGDVSANLLNGGIPKLTYNSFNPNKVTDSLIGSILVNGFERSVYFQREFPYGYLGGEVSPPEPEPGIIINSIIVSGQTEQGLSDGSAIVNATGGGQPFEYTINGIDYNTSNVFSNLAPGTYQTKVRSISNINSFAESSFYISEALPEAPEINEVIKDVIVVRGAEISIQNAYKRIEVLSEFGKVPSLLYNGDFEDWDGQNFNFWTRYGGLNFDRVQRSVTNATGLQIPIDNYAIRFNEKANTGKWIETAPIPFQIKDTGSLQYRVGKTMDVSEYSYIDTIDLGIAKIYIKHDIKTFYAAKLRIKIGNYYLYNADYGTSFQWVTNLATISNPIYNKDGDINTYSYSFQIPECPVTGNLVIQFFGFEKVQMDSATAQQGNGNTTTTYKVISEYSPVTMDDISLSKTSQSASNDVIGVLSVSENLGFYTEKPDQVKIPFGDYFTSSAGSGALSNLYAITVGNSYTTGWYEYGTTNSPIAFGLSLAKSILRAYQKPFRLWIGELTLKPMSDEFTYLNTINFEVPGQEKFNRKVFSFLGADFDLKTNQASNVRLAEIFDRPGKSIDITVPNYPGSNPPVFVQDPTGNVNNSGIFTEEFTPEFN